MIEGIVMLINIEKGPDPEQSKSKLQRFKRKPQSESSAVGRCAFMAHYWWFLALVSAKMSH